MSIKYNVVEIRLIIVLLQVSIQVQFEPVVLEMCMHTFFDEWVISSTGPAVIEANFGSTKSAVHTV